VGQTQPPSFVAATAELASIADAGEALARRPVPMTAAAMVVGMIPMAIGGPGEKQNDKLKPAKLPLAICLQANRRKNHAAA
jgi:hypothetical protein